MYAGKSEQSRKAHRFYAAEIEIGGDPVRPLTLYHFNLFCLCARCADYAKLVAARWHN